MKKFAYIMLGENLNPAEHHAEFHTDDMINYIVTVKNKEEAVKKIKELQTSGVEVIELCGAFGRELALEITKETNNKLAVGYVVNEPEQTHIIDTFFGS